MRKVKVDLGQRSYDILIGAGLIQKVGPQIVRLGLGSRCAVIADERLIPLYTRDVLTSLETSGFEPVLITIPSGETAKSLTQMRACYDSLAKHRLERNSFILALGGGVTGDLAGFVAATYLRGVDFIQVPTTLLAQVDSSVGGKVGVNLKSGKNLVGAFYQPKAVYCDLGTLQSLPVREYRAGLAEVIKYGIIYDSRLFSRLEKDIDALLNKDVRVLGPVIARCCEIKAEVVRQDEKEGGLRAILNFGHTVGHALEAISGYGKYLHGEAISIGQVAAAILSNQRTGFPEKDVERVRNLFRAAGLPVSVRLNQKDRVRLHTAMKLDKKVREGHVQFVLAEKMGQVSWGHPVSEKEIDGVLDQIME